MLDGLGGRCNEWCYEVDWLGGGCLGDRASVFGRPSESPNAEGGRCKRRREMGSQWPTTNGVKYDCG